MIESVEVGILTPSSIAGRDCGRRFLELLCESAPEYCPKFYNNYEPINRKFNPKDFDKALDLWSDNFLWATARPRCLGRSWFGPGKHHHVIYISVPAHGFKLDSTISFFVAMDRLFEIDIGYIYVRASWDAADLEEYKRYFMPFSQGLTTRMLADGLPCLCWGMMFGKPYRDLFGEKLCDTPVYSVEEGCNGMFLQLTENVEDVDNRDIYFDAQNKAKEHLGLDAFIDRGRGATKLPDFGLLPRA